MGFMSQERRKEESGGSSGLPNRQPPDFLVLIPESKKSGEVNRNRDSPVRKADREKEMKRRFVNAPLIAPGVPFLSSFSQAADEAPLSLATKWSISRLPSCCSPFYKPS